MFKLKKFFGIGKDVPEEVKKATDKEIDEALQPLEEDKFFEEGERASAKNRGQAVEDIKTQEAIDEVAIRAEIERQARPKLERLVNQMDKDLSINIPVSDIDAAIEVLANAAVMDAAGTNKTEYKESDAARFLTPEVIADALSEKSEEVKDMKQAIVEEFRRMAA